MKFYLLATLSLIGCMVVVTRANPDEHWRRHERRSAAKRATGRSGLDGARMDDGTPGCVYDADSYAVTCQYLTAGTVNLLEQALDDVSQMGVIYGVEILYSDVDALPVDVFSGYVLQFLTFQSNNLTAIPYDLLANVDASPISYYGFLYEDLLTTFTAPVVTLPYASYVNDMYVTFCSGVTSLEEGAFDQYTNITYINVNDNNLDRIGFEMLGMTSLIYLDYADQKIDTIETGAFADLSNLRALFLDNNNLQFLQEGAFDGLPYLEALGLGGNPFNCTCELQWLKDYLSDTGLMISSGASCVTPFEGPFTALTFCPNTTTTLAPP